MKLPWDKADLLNQLTVVVEEVTRLRAEIVEEKRLRVHAEQIAEERRGHVEYLKDALAHSQDERRELSSARIASLDLVNTKLLEAYAPEVVGKPGGSHVIRKDRVQAGPLMRRAERGFTSSLIQAHNEALAEFHAKAVKQAGDKAVTASVQ